MSPELEDFLREIIFIMYEYSREEGDDSYLALADELSAIIVATKGDLD